MEIILSVIVSLVIGVLPLKKILALCLFSYKNIYMEHYEFKKCYDIWGNLSYILPIMDFLKGPTLYYILKIINIQPSPLAAILLVVLWKVNPLKDSFKGKGMSVLLGVSLVINIDIFKLLVLMYLSLLILSRYQGIAGFVTAIVATPMSLINTNCTLIELTIITICSCFVLLNYKSSFYQIFSKRFFHLSH